MKISGKITKILEVQTGKTKEDKEWKKVEFIVETNEEYNNLYAFSQFGAEKVDNFLKYNKVGQEVDVEFNVQTNEYKGKYYTNLSAWKVFKAEVAEAQQTQPEGLGDDQNPPF